MGDQTLLLYTTEARLYDVAFSWDTEDEIDWLLMQFGEDCAPVLEPACGSGRYLVALARRGIEAIGIDTSAAMVRIAQERLQAQRLSGDAVVAEMSAFNLGRVFGGAICPLDSLAYLQSRARLIRHLRCMAQHMRPSSKYLIQLELRGADDPWRGIRPSTWEQERDGIRVRAHWRVEEIDVHEGVELHRATIECLAGPNQGRVFEEVHRMAAWTPARWARAIAETPFRYVAVYDGGERDRPERPIGTSGRLLWHELLLEGR